MRSRLTFLGQVAVTLVAIASLVALTGCTKKMSGNGSAVDLKLDAKTPFQFVAYGDTRFHDPNDTKPANPAVRVTLVKAIAETHPAFVCLTGDIVYNGNDADDWKVWDNETDVWRAQKTPIYPALGNHDLHGDQTVALGNYFRRFPDLKNSRYYSARVANALILALDSSLPEVGGPQGKWLAAKLDQVPADVDFVFILDHHPPYTSSSDSSPSGGHSARESERALAKMLEDGQARAHYRIVVFSGHVHNYERHEHGGVTYFVSGGGGARPYSIERAPGDLFKGNEVNYHYLLITVDHQKLTVTMNRLSLTTGKATWTQPDSVSVTAPSLSAAQAASR